MTLEELNRREFASRGFTIIDNVIDFPEEVSRKILSSNRFTEVSKPEPTTLIPGGKGSLKWQTLDRFSLDACAPEIGEVYCSLLPVLRSIVGSTIVVSEDERSAYTAKAYINDGDEQGWHYDSNEVTGVLYLTTSCHSGFTEIHALNSDEPIQIHPKAGSLLILDGRECWHRATPVWNGDVKVVCPFNYFRAGSLQRRDSRMNPTIFGEGVESMTKRLVLLKAGPTNTDNWVENLNPLLPGFDVQRWDSVYEPSEVEYIVGWMPNALWANQFPNLKALISIGSGVDHIKHLDEFRDDVPIIRTVSEDLVQRMTEFVVASVLCWQRRIPEMIINQRSSMWQRYAARTAQEINVGVLGYGTMAQSAVRVLKEIGYNVSAWANAARTDLEIEYFHGQNQLEQFAKDLDVVVCMLPNTPQTRHVLSKALFTHLNSQSCIINVGRGAHLKECDLVDALSTEKVGMAVLDVFEQEPLPQESMLWSNPKILISSHSAAYISPEVGPKIISSNILKFDCGENVGPIYDPVKGY